jgi:hypothetical protein
VRKGLPFDDVERWLRPNLAYERGADPAPVSA